MAKHGHGKIIKAGRNCRWVQLHRIDGRTQEGQVIIRTRNYLTEWIGGDPTVPQQLLIERAAHLSLRVSQIEAKMVEGDLTAYDSNHYLSWVNALGKTLAKLGIKKPKQEHTETYSLMDYLKRTAAAPVDAPAPGGRAMTVLERRWTRFSGVNAPGPINPRPGPNDALAPPPAPLRGAPRAAPPAPG